MRPDDRDRFDRLLERVLEMLPARLHEMLDQTPLIVEDYPSAELLEELGMDPDTEGLCGLHPGTPLTERSVLDSHDPPETIHLFREEIVEEAGGWAAGADAIAEEIRITVLHEIGHHFGLEEDDLEALGYE